MADRNIDQSIRKPRRTKGTPFYSQRNYYAFGAFVISGFTWWLYEQWSQTRILKKSIKDGRFKTSEQWEAHVMSMQRTLSDPAVAVALADLRK